ncbi:MAG: ATP-binding cassette domain-containing protein [Pseudomonadota bacterium]
MKNIIEVNNLVSKYNDKVILDNVSLAIQEGEIFVILGGSGCGKTTLLKNLIGLIKPAAGDIKIFGKSIIGLEADAFDEVLKRVGMLFQQGALINSQSIWQNVSIPLEQHTDLPLNIIKELVKQKLSLVNMSHAYNLLPSELSGGMKKRAALARSIALEPEILFFDEPAAGLDPITLRSLDELILNLKANLGITMVIVTHELESIKRIADRIAYLKDGKCIFCGGLFEAEAQNNPVINEFFGWNN